MHKECFIVIFVFLPLFTGFVYLFIYSIIIFIAKSTDVLGNTYKKDENLFICIYLFCVYTPA